MSKHIDALYEAAQKNASSPFGYNEADATYIRLTNPQTVIALIECARAAGALMDDDCAGVNFGCNSAQDLEAAFKKLVDLG